MKSADIETGTVYAYRRGAHGGYTPTLVLDTSQMWERHYRREGHAFTPRPGKRPGKLGGYSSTAWGFLAVKAAAWYVGEDDATGPEQLTEWLAMVDDPHHLTPESVEALRKSLPKGLEMTYIDNRHLIGEWSAVIEDAEAEDAAARDQRDREAAERRRLAAVYERTLAAWRERFGPQSGFVWDSYTTDSFNARVPLDMLAELLGERTTEQ
jgi:hypothetical protein